MCSLLCCLSLMGTEPIILLYFAAVAYDATEWLAMELTWCLYSVLLSALDFGSHLWNTINNYAFYLSSLENQSMEETSFENFELVVQTSLFLLLCLLHVFQAWSKVKQLFKNPTQKPVLGLDTS